MSKKSAFQFSYGQHISIFGGTGSGKTHLSLHLLEAINQQVQYLIPTFIIDSKRAGDFDKLKKQGLAVAYETIPPLRNKNGAPYIIWEVLEDDKETYDAFFKMIYDSKMPCIIYIDELSNLTGRTGIPPRYMGILWKQGRGLKQSVFCVSQTARYVPLEFTSQLMHVFMMNLNSGKDTKKLEDLLGDFAKMSIADSHGFYYRDVTKPLRTHKPTYYENVQEFLGT